MCGRRDETLLLDDMVASATRIVSVVKEQARGSIGGNASVDEIVLWNLMVLGEASKGISASTRDRFPDVPWSELARTRDFLVHHYEGIDWPVIEQTCRNDLPPLLPRLAEIRRLLRNGP